MSEEDHQPSPQSPNTETDGVEPDWDETPVTLNFIQFLIDTHPDYRVVGHTSQAGFQYRLVSPERDGEFESGAAGDFVSWVSTLSDRLEAREDDEWPTFPCPECGEFVWLDGFDDATTVRGEGDHRQVRHCGVCEFVAIRRYDGEDAAEGDE